MEGRQIPPNVTCSRLRCHPEHMNYEIHITLQIHKLCLQHYRPFGYERMHLPLCKEAATPFHIQEDVISSALF